MKSDFMKNQKLLVVVGIAIVLVGGLFVFFRFKNKNIQQEQPSFIEEIAPDPADFTKEKIVARAPIIAIGIIKDMQAKKVPSLVQIPPDASKEVKELIEQLVSQKKEHTIVVTDFRLNVETYIKNEIGFNQPELTIRFWGGVIGNEAVGVEMALEKKEWPPLLPGQKVLVFLSPYTNLTPDQPKDIFGLQPFGKYIITTDNRIGTSSVGEKRSLEDRFGKSDFTLEEFVQEIKNIDKLNNNQ